MNEADLKGYDRKSGRKTPSNNAEAQARFRARRDAELADLRQQVARLSGSDRPLADQIAATVETLSGITARLIAPDDNRPADETAAQLAAAAEITRARHNAAAALKILQDNARDAEALEASLQARAAREARHR